ncbi:class I SAM-dependent methyltransferase [Pseudonocardia nigra]|uniref:class I SAM-dependent methyltransferase n=1 Tax=Pseudonocardia nigra TaxID=1921578 RepID=UPI001C5D3591|nr:class I SAM-dependent methyltransferase [Pseudonocardia nigra]
MSLDQDQLEQAVGSVFADLGVGFTGPVVVLGDRLRLWTAMAGAGPLTPAELAARTGTVERYVREWLSTMAVAGYVHYDPAARTFTLTDEMAAVFADDASPTSLIGVFPALIACWTDLDAVERFFRSGGGMGWGEHHPALNGAQARFTRPMYGAGLARWIGALDGVAGTLERGGRIADIGCGYGVASLLMAEAFPAATVVGIDIDPGSVATARKAAADAGVGNRVAFEVADATAFPGLDYDLVVFTDCLHDLGDPVAAAAHARSTLAPGGTVLVVEPLAADRLEDDFSNPYARIGYSVSTLVCTPSSLAQPGARALGTMAGEKRLRQVLADAGYSRVRRVAQDAAPLNIVLEARP